MLYFFISNYKKRDLIVTKDRNNVSIVTCNYIHINKLFAEGELNNLNNSNRYLAFQEEVKKNLSIRLTNLENGKYVIHQKFVNKKYGSVFDCWHKMFHDEELTSSEDIELLKMYSAPGVDQKTIEVSDNEISLNIVMEPHEIRLIEINRVYE